MTNQILRERLFKPGAYFELGHYVGQGYQASGINLLDLLGTYKSISASDRFRNGVPNPVNLLIWHLLFSGLSKDISLLCDGPSETNPRAAHLAENLDPAFITRVRSLCAWPSTASRTDAALLEYWMSVMSYDAPLSEFYEWKRFARSPEMSKLQGAEAVESITLSILYNPYFLLRQ